MTVRSSPQAGFTLVELLVIIAIIVILALGGFSLFTSAQQKARDTLRMRDVQTFLTAIEQMNLGKTGGGGTCGDNGFPVDGSYENFYKKLQDTGYSDSIPKDPLDTGDYKYRYKATDNCLGYELSVKFEHTSNTSRHDDDKDGGNDPDRYEVGTPDCLGTGAGSDPANCADTAGAPLDTGTAETNLQYE